MVLNDVEHPVSQPRDPLAYGVAANLPIGVSVFYKPGLGTGVPRHHLSRMETRLIIAYSLIAIMVLAGIAWVAYARHNTRDRRIARQRLRETAARKERQDQLP